MGEVRLEPLKTKLGLLALRDVVDEAGEDAPFTEPGFADRKLDWKRVAVPVASRRDPPNPDDLALTGFPIMLQISVVPLAVRRGHQHRDILAQDLGLGVAEHLLGSRAEGKDAAILVDDHHRVWHGREDRAQVRFAIRAQSRGLRRSNHGSLSISRRAEGYSRTALGSAKLRHVGNAKGQFRAIGSGHNDLPAG